MGFGYNGKILHVNLTTKEIVVEEQFEEFYRKYLGGPGIGLYYLLREDVLNTNPLGPENILVFAPGLLTGTPSPCVPRYTVMAKSPLTGALGKSEAGGFWAPQLKQAGFDAIVVKGKADKPVYLWINNGEVEIRSAEHIWGTETAEAEEIIRQELGDQKVQVAQTGPAGENQVLYAGITNDLSHFNGRNGLGAVMGSKNLRAIAVRGTQSLELSASEKMKEIFKWVGQEIKVHPLSSALHNFGTPAGITTVNAGGSLPTRNWQDGVFEQAEDIGVEKLNNYLVEKGGCYGCAIRCKRVVEIQNEAVTVERRYGGPEYETLAAIGSNCGISNLELVCKANEVCNRYCMDTISAGMAISFAMECYEKGLITKEDTDGLELNFGNEEVILPLLSKIAKREGIGNLLADGTKLAAKKIGQGSEKYIVEVKGQEVPMHDPRVKTGLGLQYALSFNGADHWFAQHDPFFATKDGFGTQAMALLGLSEPVGVTDLGVNKVKLILYTSYLISLYDMLGACALGFVARSVVPLKSLVELVEAATGWETSLWELMKAGERSHAMGRTFNTRCGLTRKDDRLPAKFFNPINKGPLDGKMPIDERAFQEAVDLYYEMAGWDKERGSLSRGKLAELGLEWLL